MKYTILIFSLVFTFSLSAQDKSEWRGPDRTGVYNETNLLKEWSENGPKQLWIAKDLPKGYSSVAVANDMLYLTGIESEDDVLVALDKNGAVKWKTVYGRAWNASYSDSRATPTLEKDRIYVSSGMGDVACVNANSGEIVWQVKASEKYGGVYGRWGISESLLLYKDKVYFTPGGDETTMIALNKMTGELIWKSKSIKDRPSYTSPIIIERNGKKQIVQVTNDFILGISPDKGEIIWKFDFSKQKSPKGRNNQTNTPLYFDGKLYVTSGYNHYGVMLDISEDVSSVDIAWVDSTLDVHHGGYVKVGDYIYGANWLNNREGNWCCIDWNTGKTMYEHTWENKGSIISADGMLYCYEEFKGNLALVKARPEKFDLVSTFQITEGTGPHWSHPVIHNGVLYIRHQEVLIAYDLRN